MRTSRIAKMQEDRLALILDRMAAAAAVAAAARAGSKAAEKADLHLIALSKAYDRAAIVTRKPRPVGASHDTQKDVRERRQQARADKNQAARDAYQREMIARAASKNVAPQQNTDTKATPPPAPNENTDTRPPIQPSPAKASPIVGVWTPEMLALRDRARK